MVVACPAEIGHGVFKSAFQPALGINCGPVSIEFVLDFKRAALPVVVIVTGRITEFLILA